MLRWILQECGDFTWRVSDCEELVGDVNHTTECVTDLFSFVDVEWRFGKGWNTTNYDKEGNTLGKYVNGKWIKN